MRNDLQEIVRLLQGRQDTGRGEPLMLEAHCPGHNADRAVIECAD
jgi:hypothetical protein